MLETVSITDVKKNERGWTEITLKDDDRVVATRDEKLIEAATKAVGGDPVEVKINTRVKGTYTNHYLESVGGVEGDKPAFTGRITRPGPVLASTSRAVSSGKDQERIARQWAYGRAIELLMASEQEVGFPPDQFQKDALKEVADWLLDSTK